MIEFIKNYLNPNCKKIITSSYVLWFFVGLLIQFLYNIYAFIVKHNMYVSLVSILSAFVSAIILVLVGWLINSIIVYVIYKIVLRDNKLLIRKHIFNYLPYYISQNFYFIMSILILSLFGIENSAIIKIVELIFSIYTCILYIRRKCN